MSKDDRERRVVSQKELAREFRRAAYQKAKERRASDPKYLAMKEANKQARRDFYQRIKQERKKAKAVEKEKESERKAATRATRDAQLMKWVREQTKGPSALN